MLSIPVLVLACSQNWICNLQQDTYRNGSRRWFPKLLRRQSSGGCRFNSDCGQVVILNVCTLLWLTESEQVTPVHSIKDIVRSSMYVLEFYKRMKKVGKHIVVEKMMKTLVWKLLMIKIIKLCLRNLLNWIHTCCFDVIDDTIHLTKQYENKTHGRSIYVNGMPTYIGVFDASILGNGRHCTFIFTLWCVYLYTLMHQIFQPITSFSNESIWTYRWT